MSDFQAAAGIQGRNFEDVAATFLTFLGWTVTERHAIVEGVEIDFIATNPNKDEWWIECKGSHRGRVPGSRRGDTVKKAIGVAWYLSRLPDRRPYMLVTSHLPMPGTVAARLLNEAQLAGLFDEVMVIGFATSSMDDLPDEGDL